MTTLHTHCHTYCHITLTVTLTATLAVTSHYCHTHCHTLTLSVTLSVTLTVALSIPHFLLPYPRSDTPARAFSDMAGMTSCHSASMNFRPTHALTRSDKPVLQ